MSTDTTPSPSQETPARDGWLICEHCDSAYRRPSLARSEVAHCARCGALLQRGGGLSIEQWLALTIAAGILYVFANLFPVIQIRLEGLSSEASLWQSVEALAQGRITPIALVAGLAIIFAPGLQIALLGWVLAYARVGRIAPGFRTCMRTLEHLRPWSMLEVCLLGILVALIKLAGMLNVHPGAGLWALSMLTVLLILIANKDSRRLWDQLKVPAA